MPGSIQENKGHIRYTIGAALERSWNFDLKYNTEIIVIRHIDTTHDLPPIRITHEVKSEVSPSLLSFFSPVSSTSSMITMRVNMMTAYTPGQHTNFKIEIINPTKIPVEHIEIKFLKNIRYTSKSPREKTLTESRIIRDDAFYDFISSGTKQLYNIRYKIPQVSPSTYNKSRALDVSYYMIFKGHVSGLYKSPLIRLATPISPPQQSQDPSTAPSNSQEAVEEFSTELRM